VESARGGIDSEIPSTTVEGKGDEKGNSEADDFCARWHQSPPTYCIRRLATFASLAPHEFCIDGSGKLQKVKGQVLLDFSGGPSPFLPLRSATIAMAWPCPRPKSAFSQATTAPVFHTRLERAAHRETFIRREPAEVSGALARFRLDVVEVGLK
jgi:hypothetical protein